MLLLSHVTFGSQLGPPSVARITNVFPASAASVGVSAVTVAAVGVPPTAGRFVEKVNASVVGP